jgi:hypothetical protein
MNTTDATTMTNESGIGLELTRKLLLFEYSQSQDVEGQSSTTRTPRITNEALQAASLLLERFISEARQRALLEAEFDHDKHGYSSTHSQNETKASESKRLKFSSQTSTVPSSSSPSLESNPIPEIQTDHVLKIAAEMLLDYC